MDIEFDWDPRKASLNVRRHGVTFEEAKSAFSDERALYDDDPDESIGERRFILLGWSAALRLLVVCHCERAEGKVIRIISARKAVKSEQADYWRRLKR